MPGYYAFTNLFLSMNYWKLPGIYRNLINQFFSDFNKLIYYFIAPIVIKVFKNGFKILFR